MHWDLLVPFVSEAGRSRDSLVSQLNALPEKSYKKCEAQVDIWSKYQWNKNVFGSSPPMGEFFPNATHVFTLSIML